MTKRTPQLGDTARDVITGLEGIVVCHNKWLYGCDVFGLQPRGLHDGKPQKSEHFDEDRIEVIERGTIAVPTAQTNHAPEPEAAPKKTGGPSSLDRHPSK